MLSITAVGNLASDPVQKETSQGTKVTNFRLLTDIQDVTVQVDCTVWGNRGDVVMDYIKKGSQITVTGSGNRFITGGGSWFAFLSFRPCLAFII